MTQTVAQSLIVADIIRSTLLQVRRNFFVFFVFAATVFVLTQIIHELVLGSSLLETPYSQGKKLLNLPIPLKLLNEFLSMLVGVLGWAAITSVAYTSLIGGRATLRGGIFAVSRASWALFCFAVVETALFSSGIALSLVEKLHPSPAMLVAIALLFFALSIVSLIVLLIWSMAVPAIVIEQLDTLAALKRSAGLTHHQRSAIFGVGFAFVALTIALLLPLWGISGVGIPPRMRLDLTTPVGFASALTGIALQMLFAASTGVIYMRLREIKHDQ